MSSLLDPALERALELDAQHFKTTQLPIVTVSGTFREDLKGYFAMPEDESISDVVFSRAHYSMAVALAVQAWGSKMDPDKAWVVDPTNYVSAQDWNRILLTQTIGQTIARVSLLKRVKDFIDRYGRSKLPILSSITPPLLHLTQGLTKPILSFHIAAGNILAAQGHRVVQVITDPHVREEYLTHADLKTMIFCVFDENTKTEFLEKAAINHIAADPQRVIVTGPPIDPRIVAARQHKHAWRSGPLKLCICTGGIGTNKHEIRELLVNLLPEIRKRPSPYQLLVYAGTQKDIHDMVMDLAAHYKVKVGTWENVRNPLRVLYHPQIVDANELLVQYAFPWADGFLTKPSGDMAYDAAAAGCFLLTLKEWGEWEESIRMIFEQRGIARRAEPDHIVTQLQALTATHHQAQAWVGTAMHQALTLPKLFLQGSENIVRVVKNAA